MLELKEKAEIADRQGKRVPREDITRALQVLMTRQCIYTHTVGIGRTYDLIREEAPFFERYFEAMGYELVISHRDQMIALRVPVGAARFDAKYERLRKDETLVLLVLKLIFEEGLKQHRIADGGAVETSTNEIVDKLQAMTKDRPPEEQRLHDILRFFQQKGAIRIGQRDRQERMTPVTVLPGIEILVPESYIEHLKMWAATAQPASSEDSSDDSAGSDGSVTAEDEFDPDTDSSGD